MKKVVSYLNSHRIFTRDGGRGDMLEPRRRLMEAWAEFCARPIAPGEVVHFPEVAAL